MSDPIEFDEKEIDNQADAYSINNVKSELTKENLQKLKEFQPKYILLDFSGDIRFGVVKISDNQYITNNRWKVRKTTFFKNLKNVQTFDLNANRDFYMKLWKKSIERFFLFLKKELPGTKVIVHKTKNTDYAIDDSGSLFKLSESGKMKAENVSDLNQIWSTLNDFVIDKYKTLVIDMTDRYYLSHSKHPWGPFYTHFTWEYYEDFFYKLNLITMADNPNIFHQMLEDMLDNKNQFAIQIKAIIDENKVLKEKLNKSKNKKGFFNQLLTK